MTRKYIVSAEWEKKVPDWYNPLKINITNLSDTDVTGPTVSFDISKISSLTGEVRAYTGFDQSTFGPPVITGKLGQHMAVLKAHSTTTLTFGASFSQNTT